MSHPTLLDLRLNRDGAITRRRFLHLTGAGLAAAGWLGSFALNAEELKKRRAACILVWLGGGPSQFETWDPKPGKETGGKTEAIATAVPGIRIAHYWPKLAEMMKEMALIRSMTSREGNHERATYQLHTGRAPTGALKHPGLGSIVAEELGDPAAELPNFVSVGETTGPGFLGVHAAPFVVTNPGELPANVAMAVGAPRMARRLSLLREQDGDLAAAGARDIAESHRAQYEQAARMVLSPKLKAFDLKNEPDGARDAYGHNAFGKGLLMARRLVEFGVPFVEVRRGGWDNHGGIFEQIPKLAREVDPALAQLIGDLKQRGMLEKTLVVCMGEFGRTPTVNNKAGRDHWPKSFSVLLAGSGIRGGRVIGKTNDKGTEVAERPVGVPDLFQTFCQALGINPAAELVTPLGRPIKIVDDGKPVAELFS